MSELTHIIANEIRHQNGIISFARYMSLALYHPSFGYYNRPDFTIGSRGDFITAPVLSPLFARCFARALIPLLNTLGRETSLLELGAGTGQFACDLLIALKEKNQLPNNYYIYEISFVLREHQKQLLKFHIPDYYEQIIWLSALPDAFNGIIFANEVLDALPIHRFSIEEDGAKELAVTVHHEKFAFTTRQGDSAFDKAVCDLQRTYQLPPGYRSELHLKLIELVKKLSNALGTGYLIFIDYGYGEAEYYHPERNCGTLTCFHHHEAHANPFHLPGLTDITAHVNFTKVVETAFLSGCHLLGYTTQAAFLIHNGLEKEIQKSQKSLTTTDLIALNQVVKRLTFPTEMGELVKLMALQKNISGDPSPFHAVELSHLL